MIKQTYTYLFDLNADNSYEEKKTLPIDFMTYGFVVDDYSNKYIDILINGQELNNESMDKNLISRNAGRMTKFKIPMAFKNAWELKVTADGLAKVGVLGEFRKTAKPKGNLNKFLNLKFTFATANQWQTETYTPQETPLLIHKLIVSARDVNSSRVITPNTAHMKVYSKTKTCSDEAIPVSLIGGDAEYPRKFLLPVDINEILYVDAYSEDLDTIKYLNILMIAEKLEAK